jgi:hypothetical protein
MADFYGAGGVEDGNPNLDTEFSWEIRKATIFISYASAWCIRITSPTTYSMVGALNKLPIAVSGLLIFEKEVTKGGVLAILMGFGSGVVYASAKKESRVLRGGWGRREILRD